MRAGRRIEIESEYMEQGGSSFVPAFRLRSRIHLLCISVSPLVQTGTEDFTNAHVHGNQNTGEKLEEGKEGREKEGKCVTRMLNKKKKRKSRR